MHEPFEFEYPGVVLENIERSIQLFKAINQLPENQKVAYTLCRIERLSYQEIMEVMQLSLSSIESLLFRAKTNLRKSLANFFFTICPSLCPKIMGNIKMVQKEFMGDRNVLVASYGVMPDRDSV